MVMMMEMDGFDRLPDSLILLIFNYVSDVKTLIRCRSISKRFNLLVPQTESLLLNVDCVISPDSDSDSPLFSLLRSLLKSLHHFLFYLPDPPAASSSSSDGGKLVPRVPNSPAQILSCFHRIRHLRMQLPAGDLRLDKGVVVKWKAVFGNTLRSCVILGFRAASGSGEGGDDAEDGTDFAGGLKTRVVWTISALIAASARHFLLRDVVREHEGMERLVLVDREGEGTVAMEKDGLKECRLGAALRGETEWEMERTVVPSVRMRMRHEPRVRLKNGVWAEGATLVVVRPGGGGDGGSDAEDAELAMGAFEEGPYAETVQVLLQRQGYLLEMNSF